MADLHAGIGYWLQKISKIFAIGFFSMAICYILGDKVKKLESGLGERFFVFKERNDFFMQKNRLKKKAALTMAVLGAIAPSMDIGVTGGRIFSENKAEAGTITHGTFQRHQSDQDEAIYRVTSDGSNLYLVADRSNGVSIATITGYTGGVSSTDLTNAENRAKSDATTKANKAESNAKKYTDDVAKTKANVGLDNISEAGKNVIRELAKAEMKDTGVNTEGTTTIIEKTTEIKGDEPQSIE